MNVVELLAVGIRVLGVCSAVLAAHQLLIVLQLGYLMNQHGAEHYASNFMACFVVMVFWALAALLAFLLPRTLARTLIGKQAPTTAAVNLSAVDVLTVGIAMIGIYLLTRALSDFFYNALLMLPSKELLPAQSDERKDALLREIVTVAELVIAGYLSFRPREVAQKLLALPHVHPGRESPAPAASD